LSDEEKTVMIKKLVAGLILSIFMASCAVQQKVVQEKQTPKRISPGVDILTAQIADSIFNQVAVDDEDANLAMDFYDEAQLIEELGDSLWRESSERLQNGHDSLLALQQLSRAEKYLQRNPESYKQTKKMMKKLGKLDPQVLSNASNNLMLQAINFFENAIKYYRFNIAYHQGYSKFLQKLAERFNDRNYLVRAAEEMERVLFVMKDQHSLYYELGELYFKLGDWNSAFKNYDLAKNALRKSAIFSIPNPENYFDLVSEVPVDTNRLVVYLNQQAVCKTKLYEAQPALALYREIKEITPNLEYKKRFQERIDWILWDDGNIRASEIRERGDTLRVLEKNYASAKNVYLQSLLPILWTKRTKDETNWRIALLDFQYLGNKAEGVQRMFYVIKNSAVDSLTHTPLDSNYVRYFDDYGRMCFNLGNEFYEKDKLIAYIYFNQAAATNYREQGRAFLRIAQISEFDPNVTIDLCKKTLDYLDKLDDSEKAILYKVMHQAYRKLGDFGNASYWFEKYKTF
jgi:tetratricopeptide (TPR) repeat protein